MTPNNLKNLKLLAGLLIHDNKRFRIGVIAVLLIFTTACGEHHPAATVAPPLPVLARPVSHVTTKKAVGDIAIPQSALVARGGLSGVFVLSPDNSKNANTQADGLARFRLLKLGKVIGANIAILSGLNGGEILVMGNLAPVHDGSPIKIHSGPI